MLRSSTQPLVSWTIWPPSSRIRRWRSTSWMRARYTDRKLFMFFTSARVPSWVLPLGRRLMLASHRKFPSCMLAVETPRY